MEDKELYEFFRSRQSAFDREPDESLWSKIDAGLTSPAPKAARPTWLNGWILLPLAAACIALATWYANTDTEKSPEDRIVNAAEEVRAAGPDSTADYIIKNESYTAAPNAGDTIRKKKLPLAFRQSGAIPSEKYNALSATPGATELPDGNSPDTQPFDASKVPTETATANERIVVTTKERLTEKQFGALTDELLRKNRDAVGTMLIVKAPGHKIFRQVIKTLEQVSPADTTTLENKGDIRLELLPSEKLKTKNFTIKSQRDTIQYMEIQEQ